MKDWSTVTLELSELVITGKGHDGPEGAGLTVILKVSVSCPQSLVASIWISNTPVEVGVPEITPVDVEKLSPCGKEVFIEKVVVVEVTPVVVAVMV